MPTPDPDRSSPADEDQPPAGTASGGDQSPADTSGEGKDEEEGSAPDYERLYRESKSEIRRLSKRLSEQKQAGAATQGIEERIAATERERDQAREDLRTERTLSKIVTVASRQGAVDPEAVARLIDTDDLDFDSDGRATNVDQVVKDLLTEKTYLVGKAKPKPSADGGAGTQTPNRRDMNSVIRDLSRSGKTTG